MAGAGDGREPNLELPSFFGRRRKKGQDDAPPVEQTETVEPARSEAHDAPEPVEPAEPAQPAGAARSDEPARPTGLRPAAGAKRVPPPRRPARPEPPAETQPVAARAAAEPEATPTEPAVEPAVEPAARTKAEPEPRPEPEPAPAAAAAAPTATPTTAPAPAPVTSPVTRGPEMTYPDDEPTTVLTAARTEDTPAGPSGDADHTDDRPRRRPSVRLPHVAAVPAAALSGAVAGLVGLGLGWVALQGCEVVRGVSSCGGGPGLLALLLVVVAEVAVGAALLRALGSGQATGTSLVGVGLVVVVAMLAFPASAVTTVVAAVVLPVATAVTFVLAHVAATTVVEVEPHHR